MNRDDRDFQDYVTTNPSVCHGQACIVGTRVPVSVILDNLALGLTPEEIIQSYPSLTREAITAAIIYAAQLAREQIVPLGPAR